MQPKFSVVTVNFKLSGNRHPESEKKEQEKWISVSQAVLWSLLVSDRNMFVNFIFRSVVADSKTANSILCGQIVPRETSYKSGVKESGD